MRNPSSILRGTVRRLRRPSPAMVVALIALFLSAGGASYAAVTIPAHSVGATQLKNFAVTNPKLGVGSVGSRKIMPGAVGFYRVNRNEVQLRLKSTCASGQAIGAVAVNGNVTCVPAQPAETNSKSDTAVAVNSATTAATVSSLALASGSAYMVQSNPYITVTPSTTTSAVDQHVVVTCTLTDGTDAAQRSVSVDLPAVSDMPAPQVQTLSIPLVVAAPSSASATTAGVTCTSSVTATSGPDAGTPATNPATVTAQGAIYATQLASATTATTTTTTTTTTGTTTTTTPAP